MKRIEKELKNKVLETIKKYNLINRNDKIVVGVSGGPDSICLLHILNAIKLELNFEIYVAHINHMIRSEAEEETNYVIDFCNKLQIPCYVKKVDVLKKSNIEKIGTEEAGRKVRYDFFEEVLLKVKANKIAIAHNSNDNAETILMNIFRGTGISGLKGIEPIRNEKYIRPIIECEREEIEEYCLKNNLNPKIDKSNYENIYTRNKVRNILIPQIKQDFNSNIIKTLNRLSQVVSQEYEYLKKHCITIMEKDLIISEEERCIILNLKKFNILDKVIKNRVILLTIEKLLGNTQGIEKIHIDDIVSLCEKNIGNKYLMPNKNIKVLVKCGKIYFEKQNSTIIN